jgi:hypothetical protein
MQTVAHPKCLRAIHFIALALMAATLCPSCSPGEFRVTDPRGLAQQRHGISVFGVYRDGRMSAKAWDWLAPQLSALGRCEPAWGDVLERSDPKLAARIDARAREESINQELLDEVSSSAGGDLVMALTVFGSPYKALRPRTGDLAQTGVAAPSGSARSGGRRGHRTRSVDSDDQQGGFEVSALLLSKRDREIVGRLEMHYIGTSESEAMSMFTERLKALLPEATCAGWSFPPMSATPDAQHPNPDRPSSTR